MNKNGIFTCEKQKKSSFCEKWKETFFEFPFSHVRWEIFFLISHFAYKKGKDFFQFSFQHVRREEIVFSFFFSTITLQDLTMSKMMFKFSRKNDTTDQSYVELSRVESIDNVLFDSDFLYNRFSVKSLVDTMTKLNEIVKRQKLYTAQSVSTLTILNVTLILQSFLHLDLSSCINSIFFRNINVNTILISNNEIDFSLTDFIHQICVDVVLSHEISQFAHVLNVISKQGNREGKGRGAEFRISHGKKSDFFQFPFPHVRREEIFFNFSSRM